MDTTGNLCNLHSRESNSGIQKVRIVRVDTIGILVTMERTGRERFYPHTSYYWFEAVED